MPAWNTASHDSVLALPFDVTAVIFTHYVDQTAGWVQVAIGDSWRIINPGPLPLSQTCSSWREISLSMPSLWARLHISFPRGHHSSRHGLINLLECWFSRARNAPIDLLLHGWPSADIISWLLPVVYRYLPRMRTLRLPPDVNLSASTSVGRLGSLEILELNLLSNASVRFSKLTAFSEAPHLRTLILCGLASLEKISLPWKQLTKLVLSWVPVMLTLPILEQTPLLQELSITDIRRSNPHHNSPICTLRQLHTFQFHSYAYIHSFSIICPYLSLPALKNLELDVADWTLSELTALAVRSQWSLHALTLRDELYSDEAAFLRSNPSVEHLNVLGSKDKMAQLVQQLGNDGALVPNLRSLAVSDHRLTETSLAVLVGVARSRWMRVVPQTQQLHSLSLWIQPNEEDAGLENARIDEMMAELHPIIKEGFSFSVFKNNQTL